MILAMEDVMRHVRTLLVVLCVPVRLAIYWLEMAALVMVGLRYI